MERIYGVERSAFITDKPVVSVLAFIDLLAVNILYRHRAMSSSQCGRSSIKKLLGEISNCQDFTQGERP